MQLLCTNIYINHQHRKMYIKILFIHRIICCNIEMCNPTSKQKKILLHEFWNYHIIILVHFCFKFIFSDTLYYIFWIVCNQRLHNISIYFTTAISQGILLRKKHSSTFSQFISLQMTKTCDQDGSPTWWCCTTVIFLFYCRLREWA